MQTPDEHWEEPQQSPLSKHPLMPEVRQQRFWPLMLAQFPMQQSLSSSQVVPWERQARQIPPSHLPDTQQEFEPQPLPF